MLLALIFILAGPATFHQADLAYGVSQGVPLASIAVPLSGVIALLGGLSILTGYKARYGAGYWCSFWCR